MKYSVPTNQGRFEYESYFALDAAKAVCAADPDRKLTGFPTFADGSEVPSKFWGDRGSGVDRIGVTGGYTGNPGSDGAPWH